MSARWIFLALLTLLGGVSSNRERDNVLINSLFRTSARLLGNDDAEYSFLSPFAFASSNAFLDALSSEDGSCQHSQTLEQNSMNEWIAEHLEECFFLEQQFTMISAVFVQKPLSSPIPSFLTSLIKRQWLRVKISELNYTNERSEELKKADDIIRRLSGVSMSEVFTTDDWNGHTSAVLVTTINYDIRFRLPFKRIETTKKPFYKSNGSIEFVHMMARTVDGDYKETDDLQFFAMRLADYSQAFSFFAIVPKKRFGLQALLDKIQAEDSFFTSLIAGQPLTSHIELEIPTFNVTKLIKVDHDQFDQANRSSKSFMEPSRTGRIIHQAKFSITENGIRSVDSPFHLRGLVGFVDKYEETVRRIELNQPFLYGIYYRDVPMFVGKHC